MNVILSRGDGEGPLSHVRRGFLASLGMTLFIAHNLFAGSQAVATHAALATSSRSATQAGLENLRRGNAADAALAVASSLAGTAGTLVYYDVKSDAVWALDSPGALDALQRRFGTSSTVRADTTKWRAPIRISLGTYDVYTTPSAGGLMLAEMLNIIAPYELKPNDARTIHLVAEAERRASFDRDKFLRSPNPYREMLSAERANQWRDSMNVARATPTVTIGEPVSSAVPNMQTSHFSIVDVEGNVASVTLTAGEGTFPGAPAILFRNGKPMLALGSSGGAAAPGVVLQVILGVTRFGQTPHQAMESPRFDQQALPEDVSYETSRAATDMIARLMAMGHGMRAQDSIGDVEAVLIAPDRLTAISDSRHDGAAGGM